MPSSSSQQDKDNDKTKTTTQTQTQTRYSLLKHVFRSLNAISVVKGEISPTRFEVKNFEPMNPANCIFSAFDSILKKTIDGLFEYNTDGLIFTPAFLGVGGDAPGKVGPLKKKTWEYSFKWKPAEFNTIDFYITTIKTEQGEDLVTSIFEDGMNTADITQLNQYKTIVLRCGFSQRDHGYINPCQDVLEDKLPNYGDVDNENDYEPIQFYPTEPYDPTAGICHIMLRKDDSGVNQMFTEENQVFEDNTIVEFRYDLNDENKWRWKPLRVRYDKTAELRQGLSKNYGNAYNVANSNWKSIHNPITENMISTGANIPELDEHVYYNKTGSGITRTRALRDFHNLYVKKILITGTAKSGDTLIDYACGKGGDFPKWIKAGLSFVFGIDLAKDNLENQLDGACARFLKYRKEYKHVPYALFVNGDSRANIRSGRAMLNDKALQITKAVFGEGTKEVDNLGKAVSRQYGKGQEGFNISSCQFAIHYFFENQEIFQNFMRNISECTKLGGYFIGTSYDGKVLFNLLKSKTPGDGMEIVENDKKIWEVQKQYTSDHFEDDITCLGYKIDVFQESINKSFSEFLVNYDYLNRVMEDYGFQLIHRDEANAMGLPEASGLFSELFMHMQDEVKRNKSKAKDYGKAMEMNAFEKKISFLNRYFVYKKIRNVNAAKVELESSDETEANIANTLLETENAVKIAKEVLKKTKPKIKKLNKTLLLQESEQASESAYSNKTASKPAKKPKQVLILEEEEDED
jgi:mRNA (guanine-N7-)-methyltransferase